MTIREAMAHVRSARASGVQANALLCDWPLSVLVFPVVGNAAGNNGTHFRSDLSLINHASLPQEIAVFYLPAGRDNTMVTPQLFVLPPWTQVTYRDVVGTLFNTTGVGTIMVFSSKDGTPYADGKIDGVTRIWTPQPGSDRGSVSQTFAAVPLQDAWGYFGGFAYGGRQDADFRTNIGIFNTDVEPHTWNVEVTGTSGSTTLSITVQPFSLTQSGVPAGVLGDLSVYAETDSVDFYWSGYLSSVDNRTGDGWSTHMSQP